MRAKAGIQLARRCAHQPGSALARGRAEM